MPAKKADKNKNVFSEIKKTKIIPVIKIEKKNIKRKLRIKIWMLI